MMKQQKPCQLRNLLILAGVAALCGCGLFFLVAADVYFFFRNWSETNKRVSVAYPAGSEIIEEFNSYGGFPADGTETRIVQIPVSATLDFEQTLFEYGFSNETVPLDIQEKIQGEPETNILPSMESGIWLFENESPEDVSAYTNYTFRFYDPDTCMYYYIEYDS